MGTSIKCGWREGCPKNLTLTSEVLMPVKQHLTPAQIGWIDDKEFKTAMLPADWARCVWIQLCEQLFDGPTVVKIGLAAGEDMKKQFIPSEGN